MSITPQKPVNPIRTQQDVDSLLWYLSKIKPKYRYSYADCLRDIENKEIEDYFSSKAYEMEIFHKKKKASTHNNLHVSEVRKPLQLDYSEFELEHEVKTKTRTRIRINPEQNSHDESKQETQNSQSHSRLSKLISTTKSPDLLPVSGISASTFVVTEGCIKYKDFSLRSVKIPAISNNILQKIDHKFTLQPDYFRKDKNSFIFDPATDLSLLLSEAERLTPIKKHKKRAKFPQYGIFKLPWDFVKFYNAEMLVMHPKPSQRGTLLPYRYRHPSIVSSFNDIMHYIKARVPELTVTSNDGVIVGVEGFEDFQNAIPKFINHLRCNDDDYIQNQLSQSSLRVGQAYSVDQLRSIIKRSKSPYLAFLSEKQVRKKKIFYAMEDGTHENSSTEEYGYIFTTRKSSNGVTIVVFENSTDESRSSLIFFVNTALYDRGIQDIIHFLGCDMVNKRQKLAYRRIAFKSKAILSYCRVVHKSFGDWKWQMLSSYT
jgi:hypothetical protein